MDIAAPALAPPDAPYALRAARAAQSFEALVIAELLAPLFESVETPALAGGGSAERAFAPLLREQYAKAIAARGGFGLADEVKAALIAIQARQDAPSPSRDILQEN